MISESAFLKGLWRILSQTISSNRVVKMKGQVLTTMIMTALEGITAQSGLQNITKCVLSSSGTIPDIFTKTQ